MANEESNIEARATDLTERFVAQETTLVRGMPLLIYTEHNAVRYLGSIIRGHAIDKTVFVYDPHVPRAFLQRCAASLGGEQFIFITLPHPGESAKSLGAVQSLLDAISPHATRNSVIVAIGGGATTNAAGMASALLYRGIKLIHIPTTPLAQADAAIGLKQAVNSGKSKNIYGLHHQPLAVLNDLSMTSTPTTEVIRDGLAEVAKVGLAANLEIYNRLLNVADPQLRTIVPESELGRLVHMAAVTKLRRLSEDPYETRSLRLMELGHVAAHTLEAASHFKLSHGTAVAAGLMVEARYSIDIGAAEDADLMTKYRVLLNDRLGFAEGLPHAPRVTEFSIALAYSNKREARGIEITLPIEIGKTIVSTLTDRGRLSEAYRITFHPSG